MSVRSGQPGDRPAHDQVAELADESRDHAALLLLAVGYALGDDMDADAALAFARRHHRIMETDPAWANGRHEGDCTKTPVSCARCQWEEAQRDAETLFEHDISELASLARLAADNERLSRDLESVREWFNTEPWKGEPDGSSHGCGPYTPRERALGYGTHRDPRFLPVALAGGPPGREQQGEGA